MKELISENEWEQKLLIDTSKNTEMKSPSKDENQKLEEIDSKLQKLKTNKEKVSEDQIEKLLEKSKAEGWKAEISEEEIEKLLSQLRSNNQENQSKISEK